MTDDERWMPMAEAAREFNAPYATLASRAHRGKLASRPGKPCRGRETREVQIGDVKKIAQEVAERNEKKAIRHPSSMTHRRCLPQPTQAETQRDWSKGLTRSQIGPEESAEAACRRYLREWKVIRRRHAMQAAGQKEAA